MSLSRSELHAMDRDELVENVVELHEDVQQIRAVMETDIEKRKALADRVATLEAENERLRERVATLEGQVTPDPERKSYDELSRSEKVQRLRIALARQAMTNRRKAAMTYSDVVALFDGHPSVGHAYTLMDLAANADGYTYDERDDHDNRIVVKLDAVNDDAVVHAANNGIDSGGT